MKPTHTAIINLPGVDDGAISIEFRDGTGFNKRMSDINGTVGRFIKQTEDGYDYQGVDDGHFYKASWLRDIKPIGADEKVDWSNVQDGDPVMTSDDNRVWRRRYFAKFDGKNVFTYSNSGNKRSSGGVKVKWNFARLPTKEELKEI